LSQLREHFFNFNIMATYGPSVLRGFLVTVEVAILIVLLGLLVGFALAIVRCLHIRILDFLIVAYIDVFRTLPQLVVIIFMYFALPYAGIALSPFVATVVSLGAVLSAFSAEIFWATILATPNGQWDSARALGLRSYPILRCVILPQSIRMAIPMLANRVIAVTKGTALGSAIALPEALASAESAAQISANPSPLTLAAALYVLFFLPLVVATRHLEARYHGSR
jgi:His/Glu/Gln/Arg/opine family amino acid ABC transporter permease subunit